MKKLLALALLLVLPTACQEAPSGAAPAAISLGTAPPTRLNVAQITIVEAYQPTTAPAAGGATTITDIPLTTIKQWAAQKLIAGGVQGTLEVTVEDASIKVTPLQKKGGIEGFFTDQQSERFDGRMRIVLRLYDGVQTIAISEGNAEASQMRTINEKATVDQRERAINEMLQAMIQAIDAGAQQRLQQYFGRHLLR